MSQICLSVPVVVQRAVLFSSSQRVLSLLCSLLSALFTSGEGRWGLLPSTARFLASKFDNNYDHVYDFTFLLHFIVFPSAFPFSFSSKLRPPQRVHRSMLGKLFRVVHIHFYGQLSPFCCSSALYSFSCFLSFLCPFVLLLL